MIGKPMSQVGGCAKTSERNERQTPTPKNPDSYGGGDDSREQRLPTSNSPSVITTVAGNWVRGFVSQSEIVK